MEFRKPPKTVHIHRDLFSSTPSVSTSIIQGTKQLASSAEMMTRQLVKIESTILSIPQDLWGMIITYSFKNIQELFSFSMLSKELRKKVFRKQYFTLLLHQNFFALFSNWLLHFISRRDKVVVNDIIRKFLSFLSNYNYCFSGGFALATILGIKDISLIDHQKGRPSESNPQPDDKWYGSDLDIYISVSPTRYKRDVFCDEVYTWWRTVKNLFYRSTLDVDCSRQLRKYGQWCLKLTKTYFIIDVVNFHLTRGRKERVFQFIILDARHHITPTLFCKTKFDFTFLTNWIRFIDEGTCCQVHVEYLNAVINKSGPYTPFFVKEWEEQWRHWQIVRNTDDKMLQKYHRKQRKTMIPRIQERLRKYVARGFNITGEIPKLRFYFEKTPFR